MRSKRPLPLRLLLSFPSCEFILPHDIPHALHSLNRSTLSQKRCCYRQGNCRDLSSNAHTPRCSRGSSLTKCDPRYGVAPSRRIRRSASASRIMNCYTRVQDLRTARLVCRNTAAPANHRPEVCIHASRCPCEFPRQCRFFFSVSPSLWFLSLFFSLFLFSHLLLSALILPSVFLFPVCELASDAIAPGLVDNLCSALSGKVATL